MVININEEIRPSAFDKIVIAFNQLKEDEKLDLFLCSPGGDVDTMQAIIAFLDINQDLVNLYGYGDLSSAGFIIFFRAACPKALLPGTTGMAHLVSITPRLVGDTSNWKELRDSKFLIQWTKEMKKDFLSFLKEVGLTEEELLVVSKGEDVFFLPKRMQQFLKNQIVNAEHK